MARHLASLSVTAVLVAGLTACSQSGSGTAGPSPSPSRTLSPAGSAAVVGEADFTNAVFTSASARVDNPWIALKVGRQWDFRGSAIGDSGHRIPRRVVATVTDLTKDIHGIASAVVYEEDFDQGQLVEAELSFYAQDQAGNVWHLGEYPEEYEHGQFVKAPDWITGLKGAKAGVQMRVDPQVGTSPYAEGFAPPPLNWNDHARVHRTGERVCVPTGCYRNVTDIEEYDPGQPQAFQHKFYAPGIGNIKVGWSGAKEEEREVLRLVRLRQLTPAQQAQIRHQALALQASAYRRSPDVYGRTAPAH